MTKILLLPMEFISFSISNQVLVSEKLLLIKETSANLLSALDKRHICEQTVLFTPLEISTLSFFFFNIHKTVY